MLAVKCNVGRDQNAHADEFGVISSQSYFKPKFDQKSIEQCKQIGKALVDKKYSGPLDRYINGLTGVAIKTPAASHGEAKEKKLKYHYLKSWKLGTPENNFQRRMSRHLMRRFQYYSASSRLLWNRQRKLPKNISRMNFSGAERVENILNNTKLRMDLHENTEREIPIKTRRICIEPVLIATAQ